MRLVAENIVALLQEKGFEAYFAGGCVRDQLLGLVPKDYDVATNARPEEVEALFPGQSDLVGKSFGVVIVRESGVTVEVATFRNDGIYKDGRHPETVTFSTAQEDAKRRDFTINSLFFDPIKKEVKDFVEGQEDLAKKMVRAVGDPKARFAEDKLRLLRAIRIAAALNFEIEPLTWQALKEEAPAIMQVSSERIREELNKWLVGPNPAKGLDLLDESGLLQILLPEISAMKGVAQPPQFHPEGDVYTHVRLMLNQLKQPTEALAWAVLLHDVGKPATYAVDAKGRIRFNGHETVGASMAHKILSRLRFSNAQIDKICSMVANHMSFKDVPQMRLSTLKRLIGRETFAEELELHRIDCASSHGDLSIYERLLKEKETFAVEEIKPKCFLNGKDILKRGILPGPQVGEWLKEGYDLQLDGKLKNREQALDWLNEKLKPEDFKQFYRKNGFRSLFIGANLLILGLVLLFEWSGIGKLWEEKQWDWLQSLTFPKTITLTNAMIVEIDTSTLETHGEGKWPLSPMAYAILLQALRGNEVRGVGFEMVLAKLVEEGIFDAALASQISRTPNVILAASAISVEGPSFSDYAIAPLQVESKRFEKLTSYKGALLPAKTFSDEASLGFNNLTVNEDGIIRTIPLAFRFGTNLYPSFLLQCVLQNEGLNVSSIKWKRADRLIVEKNGEILFSIPVDENCGMRVQIPPFRRFERVGLDNLVVAASVLNTNRLATNAWSLDQVRDKFVFVGRSDSETYDHLISASGPISAIDMQAIGWQAVYAKKSIAIVPGWVKVMVVAALSFFMLWFSLRFAMPWPLFAGMFLVVDMYCLNLFLISFFKSWLPLSSPLLGLILALVVGALWKAMESRRSPEI